MNFRDALGNRGRLSRKPVQQGASSPAGHDPADGRLRDFPGGLRIERMSFLKLAFDAIDHCPHAGRHNVVRGLDDHRDIAFPLEHQPEEIVHAAARTLNGFANLR